MQKHATLQHVPTPKSIPRMRDGAHSDRYTGDMDETSPIPNPLTRRPTIICGRCHERACNIEPTTLQTTPRAIVLRRPSLSPNTKAPMAPKNAPSWKGVSLTPLLPCEEDTSTHKETARSDSGDICIKCCWELPQEVRGDKDSGKYALGVESLVDLSRIGRARSSWGLTWSYPNQQELTRAQHLILSSRAEAWKSNSHASRRVIKAISHEPFSLSLKSAMVIACPGEHPGIHNTKMRCCGLGSVVGVKEWLLLTLQISD